MGLHRQLKETRRIRTVRMILAGNLKESWEGLHILVDQGADLIGDMLVDKNNSNVVALLGKLHEGFFNVSGRRLVIHDEEVFVTIFGHVADTSEDEAGCRVLACEYKEVVPTSSAISAISERCPACCWPDIVYGAQ